MNRRLRAGVAAAAIAPATVAGIALIRCSCSQAAWTIEIATAVIFSLWIVAAEDDSVRQKGIPRTRVDSMGHHNAGSKSSNRSLKGYIRPRALMHTESTVRSADYLVLHRQVELARTYQHLARVMTWCEVRGLLPVRRPSALNQCEPIGRRQTIHWKWAPHRLIV
jgi:hypothetical protein